MGNSNTTTTPSIAVLSFGYLHGPAPHADVTIDVRRWLYDPASAQGILDLDGRDLWVQRVVCRTPGAAAVVEHVTALLADGLADRDCSVAFGCAGGRHRSVALAQLLGSRLVLRGHVVHVEHRDVHRPRLIRTDAGSVQ